MGTSLSPVTTVLWLFRGIDPVTSAGAGGAAGAGTGAGATTGAGAGAGAGARASAAATVTGAAVSDCAVTVVAEFAVSALPAVDGVATGATAGASPLGLGVSSSSSPPNKSSSSSSSSSLSAGGAGFSGGFSSAIIVTSFGASNVEEPAGVRVILVFLPSTFCLKPSEAFISRPWTQGRARS